mmetsp:Transcript_1162/g.3485  ORF Transcript_1162/g.3485 Transcript_1162/m.3485 type:complete len:302 (-) Transcript_1162:60-965(-)
MRLLLLLALGVEALVWVPPRRQERVRLRAQQLDRSFVETAVATISPSLCVVAPRGVRNTTLRGTGMVVRAGERLGVLTAAHVALPGWRLEVSTASGDTAEATLLGRDVDADLAFLAVDRLAAPPATLRPDPARIGEFAIACGFPGALPNATLAAALGVVSAAADAFVVADAAVGQGMSGGPLLDADGAVLGLISRLQSFGSFHVSAPACLDFLAALRDDDHPGRPDPDDAFRVLLFNDPFNTRARVQRVLLDAGLDDHDAARAMREAHTTGRSLVRQFDSREAADALCLRLRASDLLVEVA